MCTVYEMSFYASWLSVQPIYNLAKSGLSYFLFCLLCQSRHKGCSKITLSKMTLLYGFNFVMRVRETDRSSVSHLVHFLFLQIEKNFKVFSWTNRDNCSVNNVQKIIFCKCMKQYFLATCTKHSWENLLPSQWEPSGLKPWRYLYETTLDHLYDAFTTSYVHVVKIFWRCKDIVK